jgi:multicomponent K+:H+ antiporter subunit E
MELNMQKLLPSPLRSLLLLVVWLLLNNSVELVYLVTGLLLAWFIPWLTVAFHDQSLRLNGHLAKRLTLGLRYLMVLVWDIVVANLQVVVRVLGPNKALRPGFVVMPLDIKDPLGITVLAGTICLTPGTVSADVYPHNSKQPQFLLLHVLDMTDEAALIAELKQRYEQPLLEIFQ